MTGNPRIEQLKRRVESDPASIAFAALAEEYRRAGLYEDAIAACRAGLQRHPAYLSAHVTLGRALIEVDRIDEAREELEYVLKVAPENLAAIRGLAEIHHRRGELREEEHYTAALDAARREALAHERGAHPAAVPAAGARPAVPSVTAAVAPRPSKAPPQVAVAQQAQWNAPAPLPIAPATAPSLEVTQKRPGPVNPVALTTGTAPAASSAALPEGAAVSSRPLVAPPPVVTAPAVVPSTPKAGPSVPFIPDAQIPDLAPLPLAPSDRRPAAAAPSASATPPSVQLVRTESNAAASPPHPALAELEAFLAAIERAREESEPPAPAGS